MCPVGVPVNPTTVMIYYGHAIGRVDNVTPPEKTTPFTARTVVSPSLLKRFLDL